MFDIIDTTLSASVADNGTFAVAYPFGRNIGSYLGGHDHKLYVNGTLFQAPKDFTLAFTTVITVTWKADTIILAGVNASLQVDRGDANSRSTNLVLSDRVAQAMTYLVTLGSPIAASATGISVSQSVALNDTFLPNGAVGFVLDVPRNVVAAWTNTAVITITGKDEFGAVVVETSASGTSHTGKKAFKEITSIRPNAAITAATVGFGDVLGLPVFVPQAALVIKELQDGVVPTAGTVVLGVTSTPTGLTGDVRGTYDPNSAANGVLAFQLLVALTDPVDRGVAQFAG